MTPMSASESTSPSALLAEARNLVERPTSGTVGLWPRAAAFLARRALEEALDRLWSSRAPGLERASARAQLACLPEYLGDPALGWEIVFTWSALSSRKFSRLR
jgi:hypothetical protein